MLQVVTGVDKSRRTLIEERLEEYNSRHSPAMAALRGLWADEEQSLQVYALEGTEEATGQLVGGLAGYTWAYWLHIDLLWVAESHRGAGLGTALIGRAEAEARNRGCLHARVESWSFQAPGFYRKLGYRVVGMVEDYPPGETDYLLAKSLRE